MKKDTILKAMEEYNAGKKTLEETNAALKDAGAIFQLTAPTEEERAEKALREDAEGFFNPEDRGLIRKIMPPLARPDMRRQKELAGQTVLQKTKRGPYEVTYDEDGYAVRAKRV